MIRGRIKNLLRNLHILCLLLVLCSCISSSKINYFTIDIHSSLSKPDVANRVCLEVVSIKLSEPLKRREIMFRKSSVEVGYYPQYLWASSLEEMITLKFNEYFSCADVNSKPDYYLHIDLLNFEEEISAGFSQAKVSMKMEILNPEDMRVIGSRYYTETEVISSKDIVESVTKLSEALDKIILRVEKDIENYKNKITQNGG